MYYRVKPKRGLFIENWLRISSEGKNTGQLSRDTGSNPVFSISVSQQCWLFYFNVKGGGTVNIVDPIRDKDDIQAMKEYLREWNERNYLLFLFGINSGLRVGDILRIRVKDVQGWYIKIKEQKTGKRKQIKMTKNLKKEVREYIKDMPLHHYLFQSRIGKNKPLDRRTVDWILKTAAIECGIENIGTHSMRKTFGYHYYKKTKDIAMLMDLFNHSSPAITLRYIGIIQDQRDKAMSNFDL